MTELTMRDQESDSDEDFDSDDLYTDVIYLNTEDDEQAQGVSELECASHKKLLFKVDTEAEVTAMSKSAWNFLSQSGQLRKTKQRLCGPNRKPLDV